MKGFICTKDISFKKGIKYDYKESDDKHKISIGY